MRVILLCALLLVAAAIALPSTAGAVTCADFPNQAAAQLAHNTIDADGDGIYCESLPCPCLKPGQSPAPTPTPSPAPRPAPKPRKPSCTRTRGVIRISFSKTKYRNIRAHTRAAIRKGWPTVMVLNRKGDDARRERLLRGVPTRAGFDRDEYPAAIGRGRANGKKKGLVRGVNPRGWKADVAYVPSSENRSHGSRLGIKLRRFCDGTRFRYVFY